MSVLLAKAYNGEDPTGWMLSEKLDGVRAVWTGDKLVSRNGKEFFAPKWFTDQLPPGVDLDGELFIGRGMFQATVGIVRTVAPVDKDWRRIRFCVFDSPSAVGGFEDRLKFCAVVLADCSLKSTTTPIPFQSVMIVEHHVCTGHDHLKQYYTDLCAAGAEGVMLRKSGSAYDRKRSSSLLKYKPFDSDEAVMIGYDQGEGRLADMVGALVLRWKGIVFRVGSGLSDEIRTTPPQVGSVISFGFCGLTNRGVPRFPTFIAERCYE